MAVITFSLYLYLNSQTFNQYRDYAPWQEKLTISLERKLLLPVKGDRNEPPFQ